MVVVISILQDPLVESSEHLLSMVDRLVGIHGSSGSPCLCSKALEVRVPLVFAASFIPLFCAKAFDVLAQNSENRRSLEASPSLQCIFTTLGLLHRQGGSG